MCQREYSLSSQLQCVSSGLFQEPLLSFTAASVAKKMWRVIICFLRMRVREINHLRVKATFSTPTLSYLEKQATKTTSAESAILRLLSKVSASFSKNNVNWPQMTSEANWTTKTSFKVLFRMAFSSLRDHRAQLTSLPNSNLTLPNYNWPLRSSEATEAT